MGPSTLEIISITVSVILALVTASSTTLAISRGKVNQVLAIQVEKIVVVIEQMKDVSVHLAAQIAEVRGEATTESALTKQRFDQIGILLAEIKDMVRRRP
jgi:hypothetical protein